MNQSHQKVNDILRRAAGLAATPGGTKTNSAVNRAIRAAAGYAAPEPQPEQTTEPPKPKTPPGNAGEGTGTITDPPLTMNQRIRRAAGRFF